VQAGAPPGGILVGEQTYRATERAIEYEPHAPVAAKGKAEPLSVWRALARRASWGIDLADARTPLIGRDDEREALAGALMRARSRCEPQLVTVVGVPGIGKSRLVRELFRIVDEDPELIVWRQGRSLPYGEGSAFWALAEIVKAQAGILETDGADEATAKVSAAVRDVLTEGTEASWVERHLLSLAGVQQATSSGMANLEESFAAWRRFLEALADSQPVVLVFEDLHWANDALLDFVDTLPDRVTGVPLVVLCSARPELLERRPGWGGGKRNATTVSLAPLSDEDTARLLAGLLETPVLPAEQQTALLQRAGGNPLFAEEYARMLGDGNDSAATVPETLQGVVAARIDVLPSEEKELLQLAAVLGKVFWTDALSTLAGIDPWQLDERLHALERKEFVRREHRSAVAGSKQYVFIHALVRDGAYGQMSRAARADVHGRVADWIETLPADRADDRAEILAHHLLEAIEYSRAAGLDAEDLVPRASKALRESGDRAWSIGAVVAAVDFFTRLRELDPSVESDPHFLLSAGLALAATFGYQDRGAEELERAAEALAGSDPASAARATMTRGEFVWQRGDQEGAFAHFDRARELVEGAPQSLGKASVVAELSRFLALAGRYEEAGELVEQAIEMAGELADDEVLADALNNRAIVRSSRGDPGWQEDLEGSLELALRRNSFRAGRAYINLGSTLADTGGDLARGEAVTREGLAFSQRMGFSITALRWFYGNLTDFTYLRGAWDEALALAEEEIPRDPHYMQQVAYGVRAEIRLARGDTTGAQSDADAALRAARAIRDPQAVDPNLVIAANVALCAGDSATANALLDELGTPERAAGTWIVEAALVANELGRELAFLLSDPDGVPTVWRRAAQAIARGELVEAADLLGPTGARTLEMAARLRAAELAIRAGRRAEAAPHLAAVLAFYGEVGASAYARDAEQLLARAS
jgi:tetratricopeptide (TPR) repeat protein